MLDSDFRTRWVSCSAVTSSVHQFVPSKAPISKRVDGSLSSIFSPAVLLSRRPFKLEVGRGDASHSKVPDTRPIGMLIYLRSEYDKSLPLYSKKDLENKDISVVELTCDGYKSQYERRTTSSSPSAKGTDGDSDKGKLDSSSENKMMGDEGGPSDVEQASESKTGAETSLPSDASMQLFSGIVSRYCEKYPNNTIAVHCTTGHMLTGCMLVSFFVEEYGVSLEMALHWFAQCREPGLCDPLLLELLAARYDDIVPSRFADAFPPWLHRERPAASSKRKIGEVSSSSSSSSGSMLHHSADSTGGRAHAAAPASHPKPPSKEELELTRKRLKISPEAEDAEAAHLESYVSLFGGVEVNSDSARFRDSMAEIKSTVGALKFSLPHHPSSALPHRNALLPQLRQSSLSSVSSSAFQVTWLPEGVYGFCKISIA